MTNKVLYFGYGANRDARMIAAITGKSAEELIGHPAVLQDYQLGIQGLEQIPDTILPGSFAKVSPREILRRGWGDNFESYVVEYRPGKKVTGTIWELSPEDRERVRDWELLDYGWYEDCEGKAVTEDGTEIDIVTERIREDQEIGREVNGMDYETWLADPERFEEVADRVRHEYDERLSETEINRPKIN
ncbi:MAG: Gamma-glutamylcyclotransferase [Patescibacteria group bacterium]|jgi:hypothetical protein|nr:Gamma-glutamylcyclotransferase [Patescibacteria group bacterium]